VSQRRKHRVKLQSVYVWHRYVGVGAALFVVLLSFTGILLNHSDSLNLDERYLSSPTLLSWYGIKIPDHSVSFGAGKQLITQIGTQLYYGDAAVAGEYKTLLGAVVSGDMLVVATDGSLLLLTPQGDVIERIDADGGVPMGLAAIGIDAHGHPVVKAAQGVYTPDRNWLQWSRCEDVQDIAWAAPQPTPADLRARLNQHYLGRGLSLERVLLDLHSGRMFRQAGRGIADAIAVLLIVLTISGVWTWIRHRR